MWAQGREKAQRWHLNGKSEWLNSDGQIGFGGYTVGSHPRAINLAQKKRIATRGSFIRLTTTCQIHTQTRSIRVVAKEQENKQFVSRMRREINPTKCCLNLLLSSQPPTEPGLPPVLTRRRDTFSSINFFELISIW